MDDDRGGRGRSGYARAVIGLRRALLALGAAGLALGGVLALALASSDRIDLRGLESVLALVIGWGFIGAGLYAWLRRPQNTFGPLMTATGFLFFVSELAGANAPMVHGVGTLLATSSSPSSCTCCWRCPPGGSVRDPSGCSW